MVPLIVTGHRPQRLGGFDRYNPTIQHVRARLGQYYAATRPEVIYSGLALGFDQEAVKVAVLMGIPFVAYIPFPGQEARWAPDAQKDYHFLLSLASLIVNCSHEEPADDERATKLLFARDDRMIREGVLHGAHHLLACFDGERRGGTYHTMESGKRAGLKLHILDPRVVVNIRDSIPAIPGNTDPTVYVGRDSRYGSTLFGNPWSHLRQSSAPYLVGDVWEAIDMHAKWLQGDLPGVLDEQRAQVLEALPGLSGRVLACHCAPGPCHGTTLARMAQELSHKARMERKVAEYREKEHIVPVKKQQERPVVIDDFRGIYRWLSNFYLCEITYEGITYPSTEHAFQAAKSLDPAIRAEFSTTPPPHADGRPRSVLTAAGAKRYGREVKCRQDWEEVKIGIMRSVLCLKFQIPALASQLLDTGLAELVEGNTWHDTFWGVCGGKGENHLGRLLMEIRWDLFQQWMPPLPAAWYDILQPETEEPYYKSLVVELYRAYAAAEEKVTDGPWRCLAVYPAKDQLFRALELCPPSKVRVVVVGQDPYYNAGEAHGLAFSVPKGQTIPSSLRNILDELAADLGHALPDHGCLERWAEQGVLLLNTALTVKHKDPGSHAKIGWSNFTNAIFKAMWTRRGPRVFVAWGMHAIKAIQTVRKDAAVPYREACPKHGTASIVEGRCGCGEDNEPEPTVLVSTHPSGLSYAKPAGNIPAFKGSRPFSAINAELERLGCAPIDWRLDEPTLPAMAVLGLNRRDAAFLLSNGWTPDHIKEANDLLRHYALPVEAIEPEAIVADGLAIYRDRPLAEVQHALFLRKEDPNNDRYWYAAWTDGSGTSADRSAGLGVVLDLLESGWTGERCGACAGCGEDGAGSCKSCAGTGDEYGIARQERIAEVAENCGNGTNNHAELSAVYRALTLVADTRRRLLIHSDSEYAIGCCSNERWQPRANADLIQRIKRDLARRSGNVSFKHVRGHNGDPGNELADRLANQGRCSANGNLSNCEQSQLRQI